MSEQTRAERLRAAVESYGYSRVNAILAANRDNEARGRETQEALDACLAILAEAEQDTALARYDAARLARYDRNREELEKCVAEESHAVGISHTTGDPRTRVVAMRRTIEALEAAALAKVEALDAALAKLARYEAPGPALLVAEHSPACIAWAQKEHGAKPGDMLSPTNRNGWCRDWAAECSYRHDGRAYREQHARDVALGVSR